MKNKDEHQESGSQIRGLKVNEVRVLRAATGRYFGRPSLRILADGTWVMVYIHSNHHWKDPQGQIEVMFSADEGRTWSEPNTCLDGTPVVGLPSAPSSVDSPEDPVEPYFYLAPNGDLVVTCMNVDLTGLGEKNGKLLKPDGCAWITVSSNKGHTWDPWRKVSFTNVPDGFSADDIDLTQDSFVDGKDIYASSRMGTWGSIKSDNPKVLAGVFKSSDNGRTWQFINFIDSEKNITLTKDCESGIERVGPTDIVTVMRGTLGGCALPWLARSNDMGKTWTKLVQADEQVNYWKRPRIYTRDHLRHLSGVESISEWWNDNLLLGTGVIQVTPDQRNVGLWYSVDKGTSWSAPLPLDEVTGDAGYGDLRMRKNGEIVIVSYHGSHDEAAIKQYIVGMEQ